MNEESISKVISLFTGFNMLAKLLDYDLSEFEVKKKEDFLIKKMVYIHW